MRRGEPRLFGRRWPHSRRSAGSRAEPGGGTCRAGSPSVRGAERRGAARPCGGTPRAFNFAFEPFRSGIAAPRLRPFPRAVPGSSRSPSSPEPAWHRSTAPMRARCHGNGRPRPLRCARAVRPVAPVPCADRRRKGRRRSGGCGLAKTLPLLPSPCPVAVGREAVPRRAVTVGIPGAACPSKELCVGGRLASFSLG